MLSKPFVLLGKEIPAGSSVLLDLEVAKLHTRTTVKVPVIVNRAKKAGPVVLLLAGLHGDEVNGVAIIREIIAQKINKPTKGTIICIPVFNIFGYLIQTREFPDGRDLNRVFPGSPNGSLASQFAFQFIENIAPFVDYIIDFHTGGGDKDNMPQIRCHEDEAETMKLAEIFNPPFIIHSNYIPKSLRETLRKMNKTVLLFEGGKSKNLAPKVIAHGVRGAKNILIHLGLIEGIIEETVTPIHIKKTKWLRAPFSGMLKLNVKNGTYVKKKEVLGVILDPFGDFKKKVYAPFDGHIFCINKTPIVNKGDALFHISNESEEEV
ncbi:MAG: succinylglutamate desuccinylase/aspartoacylase family protein [Flavobacteriia bacterium]|nr:succinylglutamate desuccinylase/aspartoacylase family protein [Flavobacteriia bacterium]OIP45876.1 MAG: succinylglutamate desuccinylase [Flavobacteriaceae bacterium CG2_30_31_66]PIV96996.1 MAG: succinylglutamate desuccinylase [Flavobacteriaceae bacterium CG17_big_fil_post_rev_8_21_14_2_50_31_13]PIX14621.1 MAG: succinylglutamate desuccinylase [Flavobacteriaceae bacterium CG_4_8_14_3_um_filter_31_8]PIY15173.1 MAG: succinylglutamate desuccinylase [Flavobacteriaceae bacterium CG_4_10_14_3_um_fil